MFCASTVHIGGTAGGGKSDGPVAANPIPFNFISFNQACNDPINYPGDMVICPNTVFVGLTFGDIIAGFARILLDMVVGKLAGYLGGKAGKWIMKQVAGKFTTYLIREFCDEMIERYGRETVERIIREAVDELFQRPVGKIIQLALGKTAGSVASKIINFVVDAPTKVVTGQGRADTIGIVVDGTLDGIEQIVSSENTSSTAPDNSRSQAGNPLSNQFAGAQPIHHAE